MMAQCPAPPPSHPPKQKFRQHQQKSPEKQRLHPSLWRATPHGNQSQPQISRNRLYATPEQKCHITFINTSRILTADQQKGNKPETRDVQIKYITKQNYKKAYQKLRGMQNRLPNSIDLFHAKASFVYPLKTLDNLRPSDVSREYIYIQKAGVKWVSQELLCHDGTAMQPGQEQRL